MFYQCPYLNAVYFQGDAPTVGSSVQGFFYGTLGGLKVYYPYGATGWTDTFQGREAIPLHFTVTGGALGTDYTYANHALPFFAPATMRCPCRAA